MAIIPFTPNFGTFPLGGVPLRTFDAPPAPFEIFPTPNPSINAKAEDLSPSGNFVSTYQPFSVSIAAVPNIPLEVITSVTVTGPTRCIAEDPFLPVDTTRSLDEVFEIPVSPYWTLPSFANAGGPSIEPLITITPGVGGSPATISGYFTERNFTDRELYVRYANALTKFSSDGFFWVPIEQFELDLPFFDPIKFEELKVPLPSTVNVNTFFPISAADARRLESNALIPYIIGGFGDIVRYKPSDIKKLRFFFTITVTSTFGAFIYESHMTVQLNRKLAEERLKFMQKYRGQFSKAVKTGDSGGEDE